MNLDYIIIPLSCLMGAALGLGIDWLEVKYEDWRIERKYGGKKK
jgi:hypothetical protein